MPHYCADGALTMVPPMSFGHAKNLVTKVPSILMVTWNRREYFERTISHLLADPSDFRLHIWDNGSADGLPDIIAELKDDRIALKHFANQNFGQFQAWHWFLENSGGEIAGKLDDDILGETAWMARFSRIIAEFPEIGLLGAWVGLPSEWDASVAQHKFVRVGSHLIFQNGWVAGGIFLGRLEYLKRFSSKDPAQLGVPIEQLRMTKAGLINGLPLPISFAEHLDDPRSPFCRMNRPGGWDQFAAYSARMRKFSGPDEFGRWLEADFRKILETSVADQLRMAFPTRFDRTKAKFRRGLSKILRASQV